MRVFKRSFEHAVCLSRAGIFMIASSMFPCVTATSRNDYIDYLFSLNIVARLSVNEEAIVNAGISLNSHRKLLFTYRQVKRLLLFDWVYNVQSVQYRN
jgi:hypothetical protein